MKNYYNLKIEGHQENNKRLRLDGRLIGRLDNDHNVIYLNITEKEYLKLNIDIIEMVNNIYDAYDETDLMWANYRINFEEEEEE